MRSSNASNGATECDTIADDDKGDNDGDNASVAARMAGKERSAFSLARPLRYARSNARPVSVDISSDDAPHL